MNNTIRIKFQARNNILISKREKFGFSQVQMAKFCDVTLDSYGCAERLNYNRVTKESLKKISDAVGIDIETLFPDWSGFAGEILNSPKLYLLLDDEFAQNKILQVDEFGGSKKLLKESFYSDLERAMERLTSMEKNVIKYYFGLLECEKSSLLEIGKKYNLSMERVRQIKEKALRRLRFDNKKKILGEYLNATFS